MSRILASQSGLASTDRSTYNKAPLAFRKSWSMEIRLATGSCPPLNNNKVPVSHGNCLQTLQKRNMLMLVKGIGEGGSQRFISMDVIKDRKWPKSCFRSQRLAEEVPSWGRVRVGGPVTLTATTRARLLWRLAYQGGQFLLSNCAATSDSLISAGSWAVFLPRPKY